MGRIELPFLHYLYRAKYTNTAIHWDDYYIQNSRAFISHTTWCVGWKKLIHAVSQGDGYLFFFEVSEIGHLQRLSCCLRWCRSGLFWVFSFSFSPFPARHLCFMLSAQGDLHIINFLPIVSLGSILISHEMYVYLTSQTWNILSN